MLVVLLGVGCGDDDAGDERGDGGRQDAGQGLADSAVVGGHDAGGHGGDAGGGSDAAVDAGMPHDGGEGAPDASTGLGPDVSIRLAPCPTEPVSTRA